MVVESGIYILVCIPQIKSEDLGMQLGTTGDCLIVNRYLLAVKNR